MTISLNAILRYVEVDMQGIRHSNVGSKVSMLYCLAAAAVVTMVVGILLIYAASHAAALETPSAPTNLKAITGGNSIGLIWSPNTNTTPVQKYDVYRNNVLVQTLIPGSGITRLQKKATTYIDTTANTTTTYKYKVRVTNTDGVVSAFSPEVSAKRPTAANTTAVPTVTVQYNGNDDLQTYMTNNYLPEIQAWYPKVADAIARGGYTVPTSFTISFELTSGVADANSSTKVIRVNPTWLRANLEDSGGMFLHEMTHIIQDGYTGNNTTKWATEGMADWTREFFTRERTPPVQTSNNLYTQGYSQGSALINVGNKYSPTFARNLNIALANGTYQGAYNAPDFVRKETGRSVSQLWAETGGRLMSDYADIRGFGGKCVDIPGGNAASGVSLRISDCNELYFQRWLLTYDNGSRSQGILRSDVGNRCLSTDPLISPVVAGSAIKLWDCNGSVNQKWVAQQDGSLYNPASGLCLEVQTINGTPGNNVPLLAASCGGQLWQKWAVPLYNGSMVGAANKCANVTNFSPVNGTSTTLAACTGTKAQEWSAIPFTTNPANFAMRALGKCLNVAGGATAIKTKVVVQDCNGSSAQEWTRAADGTLINPASGKCLRPTNGSSTSGTTLEINTCSATAAAQKWATAISIPTPIQL